MDEQLVQAIAVRRGCGTHEDLVVAVALASVRALLNTRDNPAWDQWLAGPFTKSVRRGTATQMAAISTECAGLARVGEVEAVAMIPAPYEEISHHLRRMQVSGLGRPRVAQEGWYVRCDSGPLLVVNESLEMSTGKTAAQVAHGLMSWGLAQQEVVLAEWMAAGNPLGVRGVPKGEFEDLRKTAHIVIEDAGYTEITAGSCSVLVVI